MAFAWSVCAAAGLLAALVTGVVTTAFAPPTVVVAVVVSAATLFVISPVWGWLQGELRFLRFGLATVLEVAARVVFSAGAVLVGLGASGALAGFAVGVVVVVILTPRALFRDLAWRPGVIREKARWTETGGIALTQLVVATFVGADVVVVALLHAPAAESAGYQALSALAKGPAYLAAGAAVVAFPLLRSTDAHVHDILTATVRSFGRLVFPAAAAVATVPRELVLLVLPDRYASSLRLLPVLAAAGVGYAVLTLFATVLVALRAYRRCQVGSLVAAVVLPTGMILGWRLAGVLGFSVGVAAAALTAAGALWIAASPLLPSGTLLGAVRGLLAAAVAVAVLAVANRLPVLWVVLVVILGTVALRVLWTAKPKDALMRRTRLR